MTAYRGLVSGALASILLVGGAVAGAVGAGEGAKGGVPNADGERKDLDGDRTGTRGMTPQDVTYDDGVFRVWGADRYATAAAVADRNWSFGDTVMVFIASGQDYPDALALGPSTSQHGPLLLVRPDGVPGPTRRVLTELQPCYIEMVGGTAAISDAVFQELKDYAHPEFCEG